MEIGSGAPAPRFPGRGAPRYTPRRDRGSPARVPHQGTEHLGELREQDSRRHGRPAVRLPRGPRAWRDRVRLPDPAARRSPRRGVARARHGHGEAREARARRRGSRRLGLRDGATLTATLPAGSPVPVNLALYAAAPLPAERPAATREHLGSLAALGTVVIAYDEASAAEYLAGVNDTLPLYRGARGWVHPGFLLHQANRALSQNVRMGPWIHASSVVRHLGGARVGETLAARGRVRSLFEKKGREFVELDVVLVAGDRPRPVAHVLHTAIYRLPAP